MAKGSYAKNWVLAFMLYSMEHNGRYPRDFEQAASFFPKEAESDTNLTTAQFEIVYQGTPDGLAHPSETIVLREKEPWLGGSGGKWVKVYGFGDGHSEVHAEPDGGFEAYEQKHGVQKAPASQ
jgi:hypothetical protein